MGHGIVTTNNDRVNFSEANIRHGNDNFAFGRIPHTFRIQNFSVGTVALSVSEIMDFNRDTIRSDVKGLSFHCSVRQASLCHVAVLSCVSILVSSIR
jgi:hypothetical protein